MRRVIACAGLFALLLPLLLSCACPAGASGEGAGLSLTAETGRSAGLRLSWSPVKGAAKYLVNVRDIGAGKPVVSCRPVFTASCEIGPSLTGAFLELEITVTAVGRDGVPLAHETIRIRTPGCLPCPPSEEEKLSAGLAA